MKLFVIAVTLIAGTWAQTLSSEYLPPAEEHIGGASNFVDTNFLDNEPAHSFADDGYRYKTVKRFRLRHRRDVNELSNEYLPPHAASAPVETYSAPAAPAFESYEVEASAPAHTLADDGYRYRAVKRYRLRRRRRDVSELTNNYLPPHAESAPAHSFSSFESVPAQSFSAPAVESYEVEASEPAHTLADDGYRYRSVKRYRLRRRRRDVSELTNNYLPPHAESAPAPSFSSFESAPAQSFSAPAVESYEVEASEPAHTLADDGYRYRAVKRYRLRRRRRDVSELTNNYLPPHAESAPAPSFSSFESVPAQSFSAPAVESYEIEASEPAHTLADDGYRYRSVKRYRLRRRRRDVSELTNNYLPPHAESAPAPSFSSFESAPAQSFSAPAVESYEVEASEPAHTLADDGYRYRSVKRYRLRRRRRDVSELTNNYLPPHAESAPAPSFSSFESVPAQSFSAPAVESYEVEASEPAHTLADDGYRYRSVKRYRLRRRY